jgi:16S rRNA A1518/A1519 N6-dimethyltransferase RsmA/KsgA/DIM1 with predicted DNA glycosylase/AP lyase activity
MVQEYTLKVPNQDMRIIMGALAELPYKISAQVLQNLMVQTDAQEKVAATPPKTDEGGKE